jgi:hypothetical protein
VTDTPKSDAGQREEAGKAGSPTPLHVEGFFESDADCELVGVADARRTIASVKALSELTVEAIEQIQPMDFAQWRLLAARVRELEAALVIAAVQIGWHLNSGRSNVPVNDRQALDSIRAVLDPKTLAILDPHLNLAPAVSATNTQQM